MATESFTDAGLDLILGVFPKGGATIATTHLGLWTGLSGTSGADATTLGTTPEAVVPTGVTEPNFGSYARQPITGSTGWGSAAAGTGGRKTVASQVEFPAATTPNSSATTKGFWLGTAGSGTAGAVYFLANFDDTTAVQINIGDIIKVTPTIQFNY
jgi:hypothetical protein